MIIFDEEAILFATPARKNLLRQAGGITQIIYSQFLINICLHQHDNIAR